MVTVTAEAFCAILSPFRIVSLATPEEPGMPLEKLTVLVVPMIVGTPGWLLV